MPHRSREADKRRTDPCEALDKSAKVECNYLSPCTCLTGIYTAHDL